jgi:CDP-6-deoxy-D-xylo-4-hexulose-3-dehydrase
MAYSFIISEDAPFGRSDLQQYLEQRNIDTRTVWTGNATRQPMMKGRSFRQPESGMPNADRVMERGMYVSVNHGLTDEAIDYVCTQIDDFIHTV